MIYVLTLSCYGIQVHLRHEALDATETGFSGGLVVKCRGQFGQADPLYGAECSEQHGKAFDAFLCETSVFRNMVTMWKLDTLKLEMIEVFPHIVA